MSDPGAGGALPPEKPLAGHAPGPTSEHGRQGRPRRRRAVLVPLVGGAVLLALAAVVWIALANRGGAVTEPNAPSTLQSVADEVALVLDPAALRRAGILTTVLHSEDARRMASMSDASGAGSPELLGGGALELTGELVADPGRVTTIRSAVPGRLTAPNGHWPALGETVANGTVVAQVSDARALVAPRGGVVTAVSAQPGELVQAGQELLRLADFSTLLARIVWRPDAPAPPQTLRILPLIPGAATGGTSGWSARLVGSAAEVDSLTRLPVYLYRLSGLSAGVRPGLPVTTFLSRRPGRTQVQDGASGADAGAGAQSVLVPTDAVVQWQGLGWAFVQRAPGRFVRVRVDTSRPTPRGWLMPAAAARTPNALAVGDAVVVRGAQQLLSAEFRSQLPKDEDAGP